MGANTGERNDEGQPSNGTQRWQPGNTLRPRHQRHVSARKSRLVDATRTTGGSKAIAPSPRKPRGTGRGLQIVANFKAASLAVEPTSAAEPIKEKVKPKGTDYYGHGIEAPLPIGYPLGGTLSKYQLMKAGIRQWQRILEWHRIHLPRAVPAVENMLRMCQAELRALEENPVELKRLASPHEKEWDLLPPPLSSENC